MLIMNNNDFHRNQIHDIYVKNHFSINIIYKYHRTPVARIGRYPYLYNQCKTKCETTKYMIDPDVYLVGGECMTPRILTLLRNVSNEVNFEARNNHNNNDVNIYSPSDAISKTFNEQVRTHGQTIYTTYIRKQYVLTHVHRCTSSALVYSQQSALSILLNKIRTE